MTSWYSNGRNIDTIPVDDRAAQYGDGLFETIAIRGDAPRFWPLHVERLQHGCHRLGIPAPTEPALRNELDAALAACNIDTKFATAKIIVSAGPGPRGYRRPTRVDSVLRVGIFAATPWPPRAYRDGIQTRFCNTRLAIQPQLAGIKTLNRLEQVLASVEWDEPAILEGLMRDTDDRLICGTMSNVFLVFAKGIVTPAITRCGVAGVMRRHLLLLLDKSGLDCTVRDVGAKELLQADEVFLTNSQFGVLPVAACDGQSWPVGDITRQVMVLAGQNEVDENAS